MMSYRLAKLSAQAGISALMVFLGTAAGCADQTFSRSAAPAEARVVLISPADGDITKRSITVQIARTGMGVESADGTWEEPTSLHLIVDTPLPDASLPIPNGEQHRHIGVEQTEMGLELSPGEHTLQLVVGDANHVPLEPPITSEQVSIIVSNLEVKKIGGEGSNRWERSAEIWIRVNIEAELPEEDFEGRRARREERNRMIEILVEDIRRTKRERAAEQQRELTLDVEETPLP
jgi:hypothetical protein